MKKVEEFYTKFKFCLSTNKEIANKEITILQNIINMSNKETSNYLRQYIVKLTYYRKNFLDSETASAISKMLMEIAFILRLQYADYLQKKENNMLKNDDEDIMGLSKMIKLLISEISMIIYKKEYETNNIFDNMEAFKSDSSIGHINRVFLTVIEAILFFNEKMSQGITNKIRVDFKKTYYKYSEKIYKMYNIDTENSLETNVKLGIRKVEANTLLDTSIGVLMHDIALENDHDYIPINEEKKDNHSIKDYTFAKYFMRGSEGISLTVSLHHEYYGHGYGLFSELYKAALKRNPNHNIEYLVSYDYKDILTLQSLTYLPAKILEVIDVYDTLTHGFKKSIKETVNYMTENFIEKDIMLDPIITNMFIQYLKEVKKIKL
ncbi:hypothetical protein [Brachyspira murdochii]|uniref:Uncharacterized protein n=2 Tax=Brachyspira murdochii TaxID=84378 RepID=D5U6H5_BRAM5|nr:hypothetical protein [Brachyspira murdochii]ADG72674.1 conserved hypothetical protein [Brachyspira murdochii DSM 12563]